MYDPMDDYHCFLSRKGKPYKICSMCGIDYATWQARRNDRDGLYGCGHYMADEGTGPYPYLAEKETT